MGLIKNQRGVASTEVTVLPVCVKGSLHKNDVSRKDHRENKQSVWVGDRGQDRMSHLAEVS